MQDWTNSECELLHDYKVDYRYEGAIKDAKIVCIC